MNAQIKENVREERMVEMDVLMATRDGDVKLDQNFGRSVQIFVKKP